jgi:hypothetical protein
VTANDTANDNDGVNVNVNETETEIVASVNPTLMEAQQPTADFAQVLPAEVYPMEYRTIKTKQK